MYEVGQKVDVIYYGTGSNRKRTLGTVVATAQDVLRIRFSNAEYEFTRATDKLGKRNNLWDISGKGVWIIPTGTPLPKIRG